MADPLPIIPLPSLLTIASPPPATTHQPSFTRALPFTPPPPPGGYLLPGLPVQLRLLSPRLRVVRLPGRADAALTLTLTLTLTITLTLTMTLTLTLTLTLTVTLTVTLTSSAAAARRRRPDRRHRLG